MARGLIRKYITFVNSVPGIRRLPRAAAAGAAPGGVLDKRRANCKGLRCPGVSRFLMEGSSSAWYLYNTLQTEIRVSDNSKTYRTDNPD